MKENMEIKLKLLETLHKTRQFYFAFICWIVTLGSGLSFFIYSNKNAPGTKNTISAQGAFFSVLVLASFAVVCALYFYICEKQKYRMLFEKESISYRDMATLIDRHSEEYFPTLVSIVIFALIGMFISNFTLKNIVNTCNVCIFVILAFAFFIFSNNFIENYLKNKEKNIKKQLDNNDNIL